MAIRTQEIEAGRDPATRYYGLVYHPTEFFVGAVSDVPAISRPDIIGIGPAEAGDGSYAAHELCHMLGRLHPGYGPDQTHEDAEFPSDYEGHLSSPRERHHGFDSGDALQRPRVMPFDRYFDVMTYENPLWISAYTYKALLRRLLDEEANPPARTRGGRLLHVIGTYKLSGKASSGSLAYVFPGTIGSLAGFESRAHVVVVGLDEVGGRLFEKNVELKRSSAVDLPRDSGAFHVSVEQSDRLRTLELRVDNVRVDTLAAAAPSRGGPGEAPGVEIIPPRVDGAPYLLAISWPGSQSAERAVTVQARRGNSKQLWQTIAIGGSVGRSELLLDREEFALPSPIEVRILQSQGFSQVTLYQGSPPLAA